MPTFDFAGLICPVSPETFFAEYYEQRPLVISRGDERFYHSLLKASDLDFLLAMSQNLGLSSMDLFGGPQAGAAGGGDPDAGQAAFSAYSGGSPYQGFRRGATIRLRQIQRLWQPAWSLCEEMSRTFSCSVGTNLYCTPPTSQGLKPHYDTHDVFVVQVSGRKHWKLFETPETHLMWATRELPFENPRTGSRQRRPEEIDYSGNPNGMAQRPAMELELQQGDLLYLPRGWGHVASTPDCMSIHLTVGTHVVTWREVFSVAVERLAMEDPRFRRALPPRFEQEPSGSASLAESCRELLRAFAEAADLPGAVEEIGRRLTESRSPHEEGLLERLAQPVEVDTETRVRHCPGATLQVEVNDQGASISAGSTVVRGPHSIAASLRFVAAHPEFRVGDMEGGLSDRSRAVLVRRLLRDGVLLPARARPMPEQRRAASEYPGPG